MGLFVCNACYRVLRTEAMPDSCPFCHSETVLGTTDCGRKISLPAVRPATGMEVQAYEDVNDAVFAEKAFLKRVDNLSTYVLSDDEYHVALMLWVFFKSTPVDFTSRFLNDLLSANSKPFEKKSVQTISWNLYESAKKYFTSQISRERRAAGDNDISKVAAELPPDSASNILMRFRQDEFNTFIKRSPNLGSVRRVDIESVEQNPGKEYIRFLTEWYNSIQ